MNQLRIAAVAAGLLFVLACSKEETTPYDCTGVTPTYTADVKAILDANCALSGCHDAVTKEDGKDFSTYAAAKSASQDDDFLGAIEHRSGFSPMPHNAPKLDDATLKKLQCWVQNDRPE